MLIQNYINGAFVAPVRGKYIDNFEPATGEVYSQFPDSDEEDVTIPESDESLITLKTVFNQISKKL